MDEKTYAFAVETAAQIEVLRTAVLALTTQVMDSVPRDRREEVLAEIQRSTGDLPPRSSSPSPEATKFYEDVAAAAPRHAEMFVEDVRRALG